MKIVDVRIIDGFRVVVENEIGMQYLHEVVFKKEEDAQKLVDKIYLVMDINLDHWIDYRAVYGSLAWETHVEREWVLNDMDENYLMSSFAS